MCKLFNISLIVPDVWKSISEELPSAFKNGNCAFAAVPIVTVSLLELPVMVTKPDCASVSVSVFESAETVVEPSGITIFLNTSLAPLAAIVKVSPLIEVVTPEPPATFKVEPELNSVVVELSSENVNDVPPSTNSLIVI